MQVKGNEFDIHIVTTKTIENLLKFLGLVPHTPHLYDLDKNINQYRIDVQGQKPNKFIRQQAKQADIIVKPSAQSIRKKGDVSPTPSATTGGVTKNSSSALLL